MDYVWFSVFCSVTYCSITAVVVVVVVVVLCDVCR